MDTLFMRALLWFGIAVAAFSPRARSQAYGPWTPACPVSVTATAVRNSAEEPWEAEWINFASQLSCQHGATISGKVRATELPRADASASLGLSGFLKVEYAIAVGDTNTQAPRNVRLRLSHMGGSVGVEWSDIQVSGRFTWGSPGMLAWGEQAYKPTFVPPPFGSVWGSDGSGRLASGLSDLEFEWVARTDLVDGSDFVQVTGSEFRWEGVSSQVTGVGQERLGLAADGVTRLLLRWRLPGSGSCTVRIDGDIDANDLRIGSPGQARSVGQGHVRTVMHQGIDWALVELLAPTDFVRQRQDLASIDRTYSRRTIWMRAEFQPDQQGALGAELSFYLKQEPVPVMLVHGLWGNPDGWADYRSNLNRYRVFTADYHQTNGGAFDMNARIVGDQLRAFLESIREEGIAVSQVDYIAHSMGGCIGRTLRALGERPEAAWPWRRSENFGEGYFHKFITMTTPHHGSEFANVMIGRSLRAQHTRAVFRAGGMEVGGALRDLARGSAALGIQGPMDGACHTLVAVGCESLFPGGGLDEVDSFRAASEAVAGTDVSDLWYVFHAARLNHRTPRELYGSESHDGIVVESSQEGGAIAQATSRFAIPAAPPAAILSHVTVRDPDNFPEIYRKIEDLLLAPVNGPSFASLPAPRMERGAPPPQEPVPPVNVELQVGSGQGGAVWGGSAEFIARAQAGTNFTEMYLQTPGALIPLEQVENNTWGTVGPVSPFGRNGPMLGSQEIVALAFDASGWVGLSNTVRLDVSPVGVLTGITVEPSSISSVEPLQEHRLTVFARSSFFGIPMMNYDVTDSAQFEVLDPATAGVSAEGIVWAKKPGSGRIRVSYGGFVAYVDYQSQYAPQVVYGTGSVDSRGTVPALSAPTGWATMGNFGYTIEMRGGEVGAAGLIWLSSAPARSALGGCPVYVDFLGGAAIPVTARVLPGVEGSYGAKVSLPIPNHPGLAGVELFAQGFFMDPGSTGGLSSSNGLYLRIH